MIVSQGKARKNMLDCQLATNSVHDPLIVAALNAVKREDFVPEAYRKNAYLDEEILVDDSAILSPIAFGRMLEAAKISPTDKVLDLGCATGYSSAVISQLCKHVVAVENSTKLIGAARSGLEKLGIENITYVKGDLSKGSAANGKFDKIFINGQIGYMPEKLLEQLECCGKIVSIMRVEEQGMRPFITTMELDKKCVLSTKTHFQANARKLPEFFEEEKFVF